MKTLKMTIALIFFYVSFGLIASPPDPPVGFRWVLQEEFSDEFNGDKLDMEKWNDYYPGWQGRAPARFEKKAISVYDGKLAIKSGVLDKKKGPYTIYGGAVTSKSNKAHYGYYECKVLASKIAMSTTFWMSNDKVPFTPSDCDNDEYSQELDIQEAVGGGTTYKKFRTSMNSNTHYRYIKCNERRETFISKGARTELCCEVSDDYHIYAAWWKNSEAVEFYADNEFFQSVKFSKEVSETPFDRPMHINMVTETYDWQPAPSHEDLLNDNINTAYYDWIRSYKLIPVNNDAPQPKTEAFDTKIVISDLPATIIGLKKLSFTYLFSSNENCTIRFKLIEGKDEMVQDFSFDALKGMGKDQKEMNLDFTPDKNKNYRLDAELYAKKKDVVIKKVSIDLSR